MCDMLLVDDRTKFFLLVGATGMSNSTTYYKGILPLSNMQVDKATARTRTFGCQVVQDATCHARAYHHEAVMHVYVGAGSKARLSVR